MDKRYDYPSIVAVKIIVMKNNDVFLVREPETNEWKPGKLGLPGGKIFLGESIEKAIDRKILTEIGLGISIKGIIKIINMPLDNRNVYQFILLADYLHGEIGTTKIDSDDVNWYSKEEIKTLTTNDFTEYYIPELFEQLFSGNFSIVPLDIILTQGMENKNFVEWMKQ